MNEDTAARQGSPSRTFNARVAGDTADEIELAALDAARAFFGPDPRLEVVKDYDVIEVRAHDPMAATGKKYHAPAGVQVRTVEP